MFLKKGFGWPKVRFRIHPKYLKYMRLHTSPDSECSPPSACPNVAPAKLSPKPLNLDLNPKPLFQP